MVPKRHHAQNPSYQSSSHKPDCDLEKLKKAPQTLNAQLDSEARQIFRCLPERKQLWDLKLGFWDFGAVAIWATGPTRVWLCEETVAKRVRSPG